MINFDNAATTFPKPLSVREAVQTAILKYGGNPGRSGHSLSLTTAQAVFRVRAEIADFFNAKPENVIFTLNCTHAINFAVKGVMSSGGHIIISNLEHNSLSRPVHALFSDKKATYSIAEVSAHDAVTVKNFERLITPETKAIACTAASNVTGQILPLKELSELCRRHKLCFIVDGAQGCGILPLTLGDGINIICTAGHKGLYGTTGTGLLITDGEFQLHPIIEGGTGSTSLELEQTDFLPDMLESGTINTVGIIALGAGVRHIRKIGIEKIFRHEEALCEQFLAGISGIDRITVYRNNSAKYAPVVSFNMENLTAGELAEKLSGIGFALRGGIHCAALAHQALGTAPGGTVRFSPSVFNTSEQVCSLIGALKKISQKS